MYISHHSVSWEYTSTIGDENAKYNDFKEVMKKYNETIISDFEEIQNVGSENSCGKSVTCKKYESDIVYLSDKNKELKQEIELYAQEVERCKLECHNLKTDQKLLSGEVKKTYDTLLSAKGFYKKKLQTYFSIESMSGDDCIVYIQFFTENKRHNDEYSVKMSRNMKTEKNELLDMTPRLPTFQQLSQRLQESDDMPGFLCCVRRSMKAVREKGSGKSSRKTVA